MNDSPRRVPEPLRFDWDAGNAEKSWERHGVRGHECEEVFFGRPLLMLDDPGHSRSESRHFALGKTRTGRRLFVAFTVRGERLRVISARDMSRRERRIHDQAAPAQVDPEVR
ncbi:MAG: BrnT family toxin [Thermoanaerobaculia bacterium]